MNKIELEIEDIRIYLTRGLDKVHINTKFPSPFPEDVDNANLTIEFSVQANHGEEYVKRVFDIVPTIMNIR